MKNKQELYKVLKNGLGFLFFLTVLLLTFEKGLAWLVRQSDSGKTGKINLIMAHKIDPEILFMGSSVAEVGFNPKLISQQLNKSTYNAAIDGTTIIQSQFVINEFLSYSQNCEEIVIGLAFFSFGDKDSMTEPSRYLAHFSNKYTKRTIRNISPNLYYKLQYVPFYSFTQVKHTYYKNAVLGLKNIISGKQLQADKLNGFMPHNTPWNGERIDSTQFGNSTAPLSELTIADYGDIISQIKQQGIEPILVITPMFINGQKLFRNYDKYIKTVEDLALRNQIKLYDFSKSAIVNDAANFYNNGHLNSNGSHLFSSQVADSLEYLSPNNQ